MMNGSFVPAILIPCLLSAILIWLWGKLFPVPPATLHNPKAKTQALTAILVLLVTLGLITVFVSFNSANDPSLSSRSYSFTDVLAQSLAFGVVLTPMFFGMGVGQIRWSELQVRTAYLLPSAGLGILVGGIFLVCSGQTRFLANILSARALWAGAQYLVVGVAEETLIRGYIQGRWTAAWGLPAGWLAASLAMALYHLPILLVGERLDLSQALIETGRILPISLILGYGQWKSGNIAAPIMIHLLINWMQVF
jgi:membrane protease YdiL (CAAX protease family)